MPTETVTHCFSTRDAVERGDGTLTFDFPGSRNGVQKVMLGSLEFPITQWTVEEAWDRLVLTEALTVAPDGRDLVLRSGPRSELCLRLPLTLNACRISRAVPGADVAVVCEHPHGLFADGEPVFHDRCRLIATPVGDVDLAQHRLLLVDERSFVVQRIGDAAGLSSAIVEAFLHCPVTDSPHAVCQALNELGSKRTLARIGFDVRFGYDPTADRVRLRLSGGRQPGAAARGAVTLSDTPLSRVLGLAPITWTPVAGEDWPSEPTKLWDYVAVEPGFYAPAHRPMSIGPPGRLPDAMELAVNRMYFPLLPGDGIERFHLLVFADPDGKTFRSRILPGHYLPQELAAHVERGMNGAVDGMEIEFEVRYRAERFVFACRRQHRGRLEPVAFSLCFHHPHSIDPARLGFPPCHLTGEASYASPSPVHVPSRPVSGGGGGGGAEGRPAFRNLLRVQDIPKQKRFRFSASTVPTLVGVVVGVDGDHRTKVVTHVNREPFSHGLAVGDVVALTPYTEPAATGGEPLASSTDGPIPSKCSAVVVATNGVAELTLATPALAALRQARTAFQIVVAPLPWCLNFADSVPRALKAHMLGFERRAYCWGVDGEGAPARTAPFLAPHVYNLDHPDYILITLTSTNGGALEHTYNGSSKNIFCKLTLYPLFREERMLPRDAPTVGPSMGRFTLGFHNPDWSPYQFHGAEFSFSLNLMIATPDPQ